MCYNDVGCGLITTKCVIISEPQTVNGYSQFNGRTPGGRVFFKIHNSILLARLKMDDDIYLRGRLMRRTSPWTYFVQVDNDGEGYVQVGRKPNEKRLAAIGLNDHCKKLAADRSERLHATQTDEAGTG